MNQDFIQQITKETPTAKSILTLKSYGNELNEQLKKLKYFEYINSQSDMIN